MAAEADVWPPTWEAAGAAEQDTRPSPPPPRSGPTLPPQPMLPLPRIVSPLVHFSTPYSFWEATLSIKGAAGILRVRMCTQHSSAAGCVLTSSTPVQISMQMEEGRH